MEEDWKGEDNEKMTKNRMKESRMKGGIRENK
jgi:hypothetical protein